MMRANVLPAERPPVNCSTVCVYYRQPFKIQENFFCVSVLVDGILLFLLVELISLFVFFCFVFTFAFIQTSPSIT